MSSCPTKNLDKNIRDLLRDNFDLPEEQITALGENKPRKFPWIAVRLNEIPNREPETMNQMKVDYQFIITIIHRGTDRDAFDEVMDRFDSVVEYLENDFTVDSSFQDSYVKNATFNEFNVNSNTTENTPFMATFLSFETYRYEGF